MEHGSTRADDLNRSLQLRNTDFFVANRNPGYAGDVGRVCPMCQASRIRRPVRMQRRMTGPTRPSDLLVVVFRVGPTRFGLDCRAVQEVLPPLWITPLADAPGFIEGVVEVRGQVVPVIDLRPRLGGAADGFHRRTRLLLVRPGAGPVALIVDQVLDVRPVSADWLRPWPVTGLRRMVRGWIDAPGSPAIQLLDFDQILSAAEADQLSIGCSRVAIDP
jgi:purine-binding chemotaxis protein CheW